MSHASSGPGTASGSGSGNDTPPGAAEAVFGSVPAGSCIQPPRVTLTIDFGTLSLDSIGAIADFVSKALQASPGTAIGAADRAAASLASVQSTADARGDRPAGAASQPAAR